MTRDIWFIQQAAFTIQDEEEAFPRRPSPDRSSGRKMVAPGAAKYKPGPPTREQYLSIVVILIVYSALGGAMAGTRPKGSGWRFFSYHPFLMTFGMVGLMGSAAITKKLGGYANTKLHGYLAWGGLMCALAGSWVIYQNKESNGYSHLQTTHAIMGLVVMISCIGLGLVGGIVLHPDYGIDNTNKTVRLIHKWAARLTLMMAWLTAYFGLMTLTSHPIARCMFGVPLMTLVPLIVM